MCSCPTPRHTQYIHPLAHAPAACRTTAGRPTQCQRPGPVGESPGVADAGTGCWGALGRGFRFNGLRRDECAGAAGVPATNRGVRCHSPPPRPLVNNCHVPWRPISRSRTREPPCTQDKVHSTPQKTPRTSWPPPPSHFPHLLHVRQHRHGVAPEGVPPHRHAHQADALQGLGAHQPAHTRRPRSR